MTGGSATLWIMPVGAEPLDTDGRQLWYATEDGTGSTVGVQVVDWQVGVDDDRR